MALQINLQQALIFSSLSTVKTDYCTFAPELGVAKYCRMHDHLLVHLVYKNVRMNIDQLIYLEENGKAGLQLTRRDADRLFRYGLNEKIHATVLIKKPGYWLVKWVYYSAVRLKAAISH